MRHAVARLVEALYYNPEVRGFDSRWCHLKILIGYGSGVDSASNSNEYQQYFLRGKGGRCEWLTLTPSCADCLEIWELQPSGTPRACKRHVQEMLTHIMIKLSASHVAKSELRNITAGGTELPQGFIQFVTD
jgi:hypothetical protein